MSHKCVYSVWAGNVLLSSWSLSASNQKPLPTDSFTDSVSEKGVARLAHRQVLLCDWRQSGSWQVQATDNK